MQIDITKILEVVVYLCAMVVSTFLIPYIKKNVEGKKLEQILTFVQIFVQAAEQLFDTTEGQAKKEYVVNHIKELLAQYNLIMDDSALDAAIESAVLELHSQL